MTAGLLQRLALLAGLLALALPAPTAAQDAAGDTANAAPAAPTAAAPPSAAPGAPQDTPPTMLIAIDRPAAGATTPQRFTIMGWAVDPEATGSGVDAVHVYLDGEAGSGHFLGAASYGEERLDVAQQLGQPRFGLSGYSLQVEVPPGAHTLYVHARRRGTTGAGVWSSPATVDVVATPAVSVSEAGRSMGGTAGCPRAPDGSCLGRTSIPSPTCPQIGPEGQCLPAAPGAAPPGVVGVPSAAVAPAAGPTGFCTQRDAASRCIAYANTTSAVGGVLVLRAEAGSGLATLSWGTISGALTYEVLRCSSAAGQSCASVAVVSATSYQVPQTANTWYVVQARAASGQVIATSNVVGPT